MHYRNDNRYRGPSVLEKGSVTCLERSSTRADLESANFQSRQVNAYTLRRHLNYKVFAKVSGVVFLRSCGNLAPKDCISRKSPNVCTQPSWPPFLCTLRPTTVTLPYSLLWYKNMGGSYTIQPYGTSNRPQNGVRCSNTPWKMLSPDRRLSGIIVGRLDLASSETSLFLAEKVPVWAVLPEKTKFNSELWVIPNPCRWVHARSPSPSVQSLFWNIAECTKVVDFA